MWNVDYQILETSLKAWPVFVNVPLCLKRMCSLSSLGTEVFFTCVPLNQACGV